MDVDTAQFVVQASEVPVLSHAILQTFGQMTLLQVTLVPELSSTLVDVVVTQSEQHSLKRHTSSKPSLARVPGGTAHMLSSKRRGRDCWLNWAWVNLKSAGRMMDSFNTDRRDMGDVDSDGTKGRGW